MLLASALITLLATARTDLVTAPKDRAIVIGISKYTNLPPNTPPLPGCEQDADDVSALLTKLSFSVRTLTTPEQTTHEKIVKALQDEADKPKTGRFVFYFAGHGREGHPGLLPSNALDGPANDISPAELLKLVKAIHADSRTVVLDACYSGAIAIKGNPNEKNYQIRSYHSKRAKEVPTIIGEEANWPTASNQDVCFYTATNGSQPAVELQIDSKVRGVFTYSFVHSLEAIKGKQEPWGTLDKSVQVSMLELLKSSSIYMNPFLTAEFRSKPVFGGASSPSQTQPPPQFILDLFALNTPDPTHLTVTITPSLSFYNPATSFEMDVNCGSDGWLVIVNRDTRKYQILWPKIEGTKDILSWTSVANVKKGKKLHFDWLTLDPGMQYTKVFLFGSERAARSFLGTLGRIDPDNQGFVYDSSVMTKELGETDASESNKVITAVAGIQVSDILSGDGGRVANLQGVFQKIRNDEVLLNALINNTDPSIAKLLGPYLLDGGPPPDPRAGGFLLAAINFSIQAISKSITPLITGQVDPSYLATHPIRKDLIPTDRTGLRPLDYARLNATILRAWIPELGPPPREAIGGGS